MQTDQELRLLALESRLRLVTRLGLMLLLSLAALLTAFAWPQEKSPGAHRLKQVGRYQLSSAGDGATAYTMMVDTRTGVVKPVFGSGFPTNLGKVFDDIDQIRRR